MQTSRTLRLSSPTGRITKGTPFGEMWAISANPACREMKSNIVAQYQAEYLLKALENGDTIGLIGYEGDLSKLEERIKNWRPNERDDEDRD